MKLRYAIVETLNGNFILKALDKESIGLNCRMLKETDNIEMELYSDTLEDIKKQYRQHIKELKAMELI